MGSDGCGDGGAAGCDCGDGGGGAGVFQDYAEGLCGGPISYCGLVEGMSLQVWGLTGKRAWRSRRVGRKLSSAFRTVTFPPDGDSPCRLSIKFSFSISAKTG